MVFAQLIALVMRMLVGVSIFAMVMFVLVGVSIFAMVVLVLVGMPVFAMVMFVLVGMPVVAVMVGVVAGVSVGFCGGRGCRDRFVRSGKLRLRRLGAGEARGQKTKGEQLSETHNSHGLTADECGGQPLSVAADDLWSVGTKQERSVDGVLCPEYVFFVGCCNMAGRRQSRLPGIIVKLSFRPSRTTVIDVGSPTFRASKTFT